MDDRYVMMTFHGTIVTRRGPKNMLVASRALEPDLRNEIVTVDASIASSDADAEDSLRDIFSRDASLGDLIGAEVRHFSISEIDQPSSAFTFKSSNKYLSSSLDMSLKYSTLTADIWEFFILIKYSQLNLMRKIASCCWLDTDSDSIIASSRIRFVPGFKFMIGPHVFYLQNMKDVDIDLRDNKLECRFHDGSIKRFIKQDDPSRRKQPDRGSKFIWIRPLGQTANRALQYLAAERLRQVMPFLEIRNVDLPEFHKQSYQDFPNTDRVLRLTPPQWSFDLPGLADCLARGVVDGVTLEIYPFDLSVLPSRGDAREMLGEISGGEAARGFGADEIVCHIRAGDILNGSHSRYFVLPAEYYRNIAERTGLGLVFIGQIQDNAYIQSLRRALPRARFVMGESVGHDFSVLRRSVNVALSLSTFAWLAAWLGDAEKIVLPIGGLLSPLLDPHHFLLPIDDPRYEYMLLPPVSSQNINDEASLFQAAQDVIARFSVPISRDKAKAIVDRANELFRPKALITGFDTEYYLSHNLDLAEALCKGFISTALQHFVEFGARERRPAFEFDPEGYLLAYPHAAMEIAAGRFATPFDHFVHEGRGFGFKPFPEPGAEANGGPA